MPIALYPKAVKGQGAKGEGNGVQGKGPTSKRRKGPRPAHHQDTRMLSQRNGSRSLPLRRRHPPPIFPKGCCPEPAASLLATPRRQKLLEHIWQRTSLSRKQFATLYRAPLEHYAELVQQFPASESHHHAYHGGMLDHGLEIVAYALKLRQSHLLPAGAPPKTRQPNQKSGRRPSPTRRCSTISARLPSIFTSSMRMAAFGTLAWAADIPIPLSLPG